MAVHLESTTNDRLRLATRRLAVAYDVTSSSPLDLSQALGDAWQLVWVVDTGDTRLGSLARLLPRLGEVVECGQRPVDLVVAELRQARLDGVIAFTDSQLAFSSAISRALGLPGNSDSTVEALTDKVVQRRRLEEAGLPVPHFRQLDAGTPLDEAVARVGQVGYPVAMKPTQGSASRNVARVSDPSELRHVLDRILEGAVALPEAYIAEEWLPGGSTGTRPGLGDYVSVEAVAQAGEVVPLAITGKFPTAPPCRETGNFMPHHLEVGLATEVLATAVAAAEALEVHAGALHIEIKLTPEGPRVIEVNGRIGGGGIDALYEARHARSLTSIAALVALGESVEIDAERTTHPNGPFVFDYYVQPPMSARHLVAMADPGRLQVLDGVESTSVNHAVGDELDWRSGSQDYVLACRGTAADLGALSEVPTKILASLELEFR